jgi:hypothetical protein
VPHSHRTKARQTTPPGLSRKTKPPAKTTATKRYNALQLFNSHCRINRPLDPARQTPPNHATTPTSKMQNEAKCQIGTLAPGAPAQNKPNSTLVATTHSTKLNHALLDKTRFTELYGDFDDGLSARRSCIFDNRSAGGFELRWRQARRRTNSGGHPIVLVFRRAIYHG